MDLPPHFIGDSNQLAAAVADRILDRHAAPTLEFDVALRSTHRIPQHLALNPQLLATKSNTQQGEREAIHRQDR